MKLLCGLSPQTSLAFLADTLAHKVRDLLFGAAKDACYRRLSQDNSIPFYEYFKRIALSYAQTAPQFDW